MKPHLQAPPLDVSPEEPPGSEGVLREEGRQLGQSGAQVGVALEVRVQDLLQFARQDRVLAAAGGVGAVAAGLAIFVGHDVKEWELLLAGM